jgi:uncharacterized membrane protein (DUF373 family)
MPETTEEIPGGQSGHSGRPSRSRLHGMNGTIWVLEHAQDLISLVVGIVLLGLAAVLLTSGIIDFFKQAGTSSVNNAGITLLDRTLLVLILVEIVHTVILSLRAHQLAAEPFIVVGLIAVIRKILFILSNASPIGTTQLALLLGMIVVFIAALIAVNRLGRPGLH